MTTTWRSNRRTAGSNKVPGCPGARSLGALSCVCTLKNDVPVHSAKCSGFNAVSCPRVRDTGRRSLLFSPPCFVTTGNWRPALFIETRFLFFFMKDFNLNLASEQFIIPNTQTCSSEHIPIMFMGQQRTQVGKIVPNRIPIMPASTVCPRPEKICSTILLLFSVSGRRSCHAGQSPFCWLFQPSIYS